MASKDATLSKYKRIGDKLYKMLLFIVPPLRMKPVAPVCEDVAISYQYKKYSTVYETKIQRDYYGIQIIVFGWQKQKWGTKETSDLNEKGCGRNVNKRL